MIMSMSDIHNLRNEELKKFYNDSVNTFEKIISINNEIKKIKFKIKILKIYLILCNIIFVSCIISIAIFVMLYYLFDWLSPILNISVIISEAYIIDTILLIILISVSLVIGIKLAKSNNIIAKKCKSKNNKIKNKIKNYEVKKQELIKTYNKIKFSNDYKNMETAFGRRLNIEYIKELNNIVSDMRAQSHSEAIKVYENDKYKEKLIELENKKIEAIKESANNPNDNNNTKETDIKSDVEFIADIISILSIFK